LFARLDDGFSSTGLGLFLGFGDDALGLAVRVFDVSFEHHPTEQISEDDAENTGGGGDYRHDNGVHGFKFLFLFE
jgi:hypothetical protein